MDDVGINLAALHPQGGHHAQRFESVRSDLRSERVLEGGFGHHGHLGAQPQLEHAEGDLVRPHGQRVAGAGTKSGSLSPIPSLISPGRARYPIEDSPGEPERSCRSRPVREDDQGRLAHTKAPSAGDRKLVRTRRITRVSCYRAPMKKPLRCWLFFHDWRLVTNDEGEQYKSCARCGGYRDFTPRPTM